jgi:hypothetical protein
VQRVVLLIQGLVIGAHCAYPTIDTAEVSQKSVHS